MVVNTTYDNEDLLSKYAAEKVQEYIPAMVFVAVTVFFGVIGNVVTVIYYGFKAKSTTSTMLITSLTAVDLITCVLVSVQIINLCLIVTSRGIVWCKLYTFMNHWFVSASVALLFIISIDRYRKVCAPFKWQFTFNYCKVSITAGMAFVSFLSVKDIVITDVHSVNITNTDGVTFQGYQCLQSNREELEIYVSISNMVDLLLVVVATVSFLFVYSSIIRTIIVSRLKTRNKNTAYVMPSERSPTDGGKTSTTSLDQETQMSNNVSPQASSPENSNIKEDDKMKMEARLTLMMGVITLVFLLSFVPYFICVMHLKIPSHKFSVGVQIMYRSYILNSAMNPYIMGMFNSSLREFVKLHLGNCFKVTN